MGDGAQNLPNIYQLLDRLTTIVEQHSRGSETVQKMAIQLGERVLATQQNMKANIVQLGRVRADFANINASANNIETQSEETFQRARQLVDEVNTLLDGPPPPSPGSENSPPPSPGPDPPVPPIQWTIPCPFCIVPMTLSIVPVVTNNNVEYECPFRLSAKTCQTGKRLGPAWKTHIKRTCLPKLTACPGLPMCPGQNV